VQDTTTISIIKLKTNILSASLEGEKWKALKDEKYKRKLRYLSKILKELFFRE